MGELPGLLGGAATLPPHVNALGSPKDSRLRTSADANQLKDYSTVFTNAKSGMDGVDKERVKRIVWEMSQGSDHFRNEQRKAEATQKRIAAMQARAARCSASELAGFSRAMDMKTAALEAGRDLSRIWIHVDMDAFFASVEELHNPALKHVPMAVGGIGMISTANYHARKFGVRSAMPGFIGRRLCPALVFQPCNFERYVAASKLTREVFRAYDQEFEAASLDEAYLDVTAYCQQHAMTGAQVAEQLRTRVREEVKLTCSCGVGPNKMLAKVCSDIHKPDGQYVLAASREAVLAFIDTLPVRKVPGIGRVSEQILAALGITQCSHLLARRGLLAALYSPISVDFFLRAGLGLGSSSHHSSGDGEGAEEGAVGRKGISCERTFKAIGDKKALEEKLSTLVDHLCSDMAREDLEGRTFTLKLKNATFEVRTRAVSLSSYAHTPTALLPPLLRLLRAEYPLELRLMGVRASSLRKRAPAGGCSLIERLLKPKVAAVVPGMTDNGCASAGAGGAGVLTETAQGVGAVADPDGAVAVEIRSLPTAVAHGVDAASSVMSSAVTAGLPVAASLFGRDSLAATAAPHSHTTAGLSPEGGGAVITSRPAQSGSTLPDEEDRLCSEPTASRQVHMHKYRRMQHPPLQSHGLLSTAAPQGIPLNSQACAAAQQQQLHHRPLNATLDQLGKNGAGTAVDVQQEQGPNFSAAYVLPSQQQVTAKQPPGLHTAQQLQCVHSAIAMPPTEAAAATAAAAALDQHQVPSFDTFGQVEVLEAWSDDDWPADEDWGDQTSMHHHHDWCAASDEEVTAQHSHLSTAHALQIPPDRCEQGIGVACAPNHSPGTPSMVPPAITTTADETAAAVESADLQSQAAVTCAFKAAHAVTLRAAGQVHVSTPVHCAANEPLLHGTARSTDAAVRSPVDGAPHAAAAVAVPSNSMSPDTNAIATSSAPATAVVPAAASGTGASSVATNTASTNSSVIMATSSGLWGCSICTFLNRKELLRCEACDCPRVGAAEAAAAVAAAALAAARRTTAKTSFLSQPLLKTASSKGMQQGKGTSSSGAQAAAHLCARAADAGSGVASTAGGKRKHVQEDNSHCVSSLHPSSSKRSSRCNQQQAVKLAGTMPHVVGVAVNKEGHGLHDVHEITRADTTSCVCNECGVHVPVAQRQEHGDHHLAQRLALQAD